MLLDSGAASSRAVFSFARFVCGGIPAAPDVLHTSIDQHGEAYELTRFVLRADLSGLRYDVPVE